MSNLGYNDLAIIIRIMSFQCSIECILMRLSKLNWILLSVDDSVYLLLY
jgi:hypothetical protein